MEKEKKVVVNLATSYVGGKPLTGIGTILNPGPGAIVDLTFTAETLPIDSTLMAALTPEIRKWVQDFNPEGSVNGRATLHREPSPTGDPKGKVEVHSELNFNPSCAIKWKGMPYPVRDLTGHLSLHPDRWIFTNVRGKNNLAQIAASGNI